MDITPHSLSRAAALCAAGAGTLFIAVQINHPPLDLDLVGTTEFLVRQTAKILMTVLALVGLAGVYLSQTRRMGLLGLAGYLIFSAGYLAMFAVEALAAFALPTLEATSPGFVQDVLTAAIGGKPEGDIGGMQLLLNLSGIGYMLGGLLFGIALYRAGVVARWASALLAVATASTLALAVLPEAFNRPFAVPTGIALIGVGWTSWKAQRASSSVESAPAELVIR
ncbi:MAG: hypothetical protein ABWY50_04020 [Aeromicrobium sp.]